MGQILALLLSGQLALAEPIYVDPTTTNVLISDVQTRQLQSALPVWPTLVDGTGLAAGDLGGDGRSEIVTTGGVDQAPEVKIWRADGSLINSFLAYDKNFVGGVKVVVADLAGDGQAEIITAPGVTGGPHIRIFNSQGLEQAGWMAFDKNYTQGVYVTVGDFTADDGWEIAVARSHAVKKVEVQFFDRFGKLLQSSVLADQPTSLELSLAAVDFGGDGRDELVVQGGYGSDAILRLYRSDGSLITSWPAYDKFFGGVNMTVLPKDGGDQLLVSPGPTGGSHVKVFSGNQILDQEFFITSADLTNGWSIAVGQFDDDSSWEIVSLPQRYQQSVEPGKKIKVDVGAKQMLYIYENGYSIRHFKISSGLPRTPTPQGNYNVYRKRELVRMSWYYGENNPNNYDLPNVPWVLSFKGPYTIHGTYWHNNFGRPMSHGCINMFTPDVGWLYGWAALGTPVEIFSQ